MLIDNKIMLKNEKVPLHFFISNNSNYETLNITDSLERFRSHQILHNINLYLSSNSVVSCVQSSGIEYCAHSGSTHITSPEYIYLKAEQPIIVSSYYYSDGFINIDYFEDKENHYRPISEPSDTESHFRLSSIKVGYLAENLFLSRLELSTSFDIPKKDYPLVTKRIDIIKLFLQSKPQIEDIQKPEFFDLLKVFLNEYQEGIHLKHFNISFSTFIDVLKMYPKGILKFKSGKQPRVQKNNFK